MKTLDTDPHFSSEAQETFVEGARIFAAEDTYNVRRGGEGTYRGRYGRDAAIAWDTPSGEGFRDVVPFLSIRNLYR